MNRTPPLTDAVRLCIASCVKSVELEQRSVRANVSLKLRSKDYREGLIDFINRSWPALFGTDVRKVSERDCQEWLVRFQKLYAPSVVNNAIGTLRAVFAEAVDKGARFGNPAANLSRMRIRAKRLELPSREEFLRFVEEIRSGARQSKIALILCDFWPIAVCESVKRNS
jgi:hypothetical protein